MTTTTNCNWCQFPIVYAGDIDPETILRWCGNCCKDQPSCGLCGKPASHHRGDQSRCCFCHVLKDHHPPADWHPACMRAYRLRPADWREPWRAVVDLGEKLLPGRPYREAVDLGTTDRWWRDLAVILAQRYHPDREPVPGQLTDKEPNAYR